MRETPHQSGTPEAAAGGSTTSHGTAARDTSPAAPSRRRGRRPAGENTRATIIEAARRLFLAEGYDRVSLRAVAREAGVDPALVHHYFDGKPALFTTAVIHRLVNPARSLDDIADGDRSEVGARIVATFLEVWDDPRAQGGFESMLRVAMTPEVGIRPFREFLVAEILGRLPALGEGGASSDARAQLIASQLLGIALTRYVVRLPEIEQASPEDLVAWVGPTIQRYVDGA